MLMSELAVRQWPTAPELGRRVEPMEVARHPRSDQPSHVEPQRPTSRPEVACSVPARAFHFCGLLRSPAATTVAQGAADAIAGASSPSSPLCHH